MSNQETPCTDRCKKPGIGSRMEHCKVCHETFAGTEPGDSHRTGEHGKDRRCRSIEEMLAGGMWPRVDPDGKRVWHGRVNRAGVQRRRDAAGTPVVSDSSPA